MSLRIKSMAVRILNVHGLKLGAQDKPRTRLNPLVTAVFVHLWCLVMHSLQSVRMGGGLPMKTDYNKIQAREKLMAFT